MLILFRLEANKGQRHLRSYFSSPNTVDHGMALVLNDGKSFADFAPCPTERGKGVQAFKACIEHVVPTCGVVREMPPRRSLCSMLFVVATTSFVEDDTCDEVQRVFELSIAKNNCTNSLRGSVPCFLAFTHAQTLPKL